MYDQIKIIKEIIKYPFALFQEKLCIFESNLDDSEVLTAFSKNFWEKVEPSTIALFYFRGLVFLSTKFVLNDSLFLLTLVIVEKDMKNWSDENWGFLLKKIQACVAILSDHNLLLVNKIHRSNVLSGYKQEEEKKHQIEQEATLDFSDNYQFEKNFIQALQSGDTLVLNKMVQSLSKINQTSLSKNTLLEKKYRFVSLITLVTRASITYGCPSTLAYRLSDKLIQKLDFIQTIQGFDPLINQMLTEFSVLIKTRSIPYTQNIVKQSVEYIYRNLYENLSNTNIAEEVNVHPAYLSSVFKKTVGTSLRKFITTAKINEAKYLLCNTDLPFKDISESLHFSNQSYFCKIFKEETSYTPKEFRILF